jgi:serine/threonine protein phosphatase PrpC
MTLDESLLTRESVAELIRLRQKYSKEPITRSNAPVIVSGCLGVVAILKDNNLLLADLVDSRCILSSNNKSFPLSSVHKPDDQSEKEIIERAGGQVVYEGINYRNNVSRAFGHNLYKPNSRKKFFYQKNR